MEAESLLTELERIARELETSRRTLGELADGLGGLWAALDAAAPAGPPPSSVVTNVPPSQLAAARTGAASAGAPDPDATATTQVPRLEKRTLPGTSDPDALATGKIPRPKGRTLTGAPDPDTVATGRFPRPPGAEEPEPPGATATAARGQSSDRQTIPFGQLPPTPEAGEPSGGLADALRAAAEGDEAPEEHPTGEFQRPPRDTLTYFFGVDGPAPDEETELGPVGGDPADPTRRDPSKP